MALTWHKTRYWCDNTACGRGSFTESGPLAGRGARVSEPAREVMGRLVGDWLVPVSRVAGAAGTGWHTAHGGFVAVAGRAGIVVEAGSPGQEPAADPAPAPLPARSVSGPLPQVTVLGIDDHRRGRPRFHRGPDGTWVADADRWATVFVDTAGGHGLLGQVEGRTTAGTTAWLAAQPAAWRAGVGAVTIDMSTTYKAAVREALPQATLAVDPFHVVHLANKAVGDVRRRLTQQLRGRRGRTDDPEYKIRNLLVRARETLSDAARGRLLCTLADLGDAGRQLTAAWRAKELLRDLLALSPTRAASAPSRSDLSDALTRFFTYAATTGATVPEVVTLAETISKWRHEIANAVLHGLSNAAAEGVNRLVKLVYRTAFGLTNVTNQQRRARYTASRTTRPRWLHPVTESHEHLVTT